MSRFLAPFQPSSRALAGADPFAELHREMNRLFDDVLGGSGPQGQGMLISAPRIDVRESPQEICVRAELPGVSPQEVDVRVEGNLLTIRGEKKSESEQAEGDCLVMERSFGRFQRSLQLPYAPNPEQVRAEFAQGVLSVHLPKQPEQERSRRIAIQAQPGDDASTPPVNAPQGQPAGEPSKSHH